ncbi:MAG: hypothetical protein J5J00_16325 [Deltaproteobacteria bacterium]|nr:hypothetical protein [Deltaproteobacteria bacterium]
MSGAKKPTMTREQAAELYKDLQKSMAKMLKNEAEYYKSMGQPVPGEKQSDLGELRKKGFSLKAPAQPAKRRVSRGQAAAVAMLGLFAAGKVALSALEYSGFATVSSAQATQQIKSPLLAATHPGYSREEMRLLTALDSRRAELEERNRRLEEREQDLAQRDREFATRLTELRELSGKLNSEREKDEKKKSNQLEQLANVYGSMNPEEAAKLIEQLDVTIALPLIQRMPEKRIGQILASMSPERALTLTKLLSNKDTL